MSRNFDLINRPICCKVGVLWTFVAKLSSIYIAHFKLWRQETLGVGLHNIIFNE